MKHLLVINFFPAFVPPRSGGEQRYYHLSSELSRFYDVTLLSPTYPHHECELVTFSSSFREHRIPKTATHSRLHQTLDDEGIGAECSALVCAIASYKEDAFHLKFRQLAPEADAIVHESPYMLHYDASFGRDGKPRIYNSYNVEAQLAADMFEGPRAAKYVDFVADLEQRLVCGSDLVLATSDAERAAFRERYGCPSEKLELAPNGFAPRTRTCVPPRTRGESRKAIGLATDRPLAVFLGSFHPPNIEAARFLCERLAPALPGVQFAIAGSVCRAIAGAPPNVKLLGVISDAEKEHFFAAGDAALNPMFSGAGTNLKLLDYLAAGLPTVTTAFGARGFPLEDKCHCLVADADSFPSAVQRLLDDPARAATMGRAGCELAHARFTWAAIAAHVRQHVDRLLDEHANKRRRDRKRLLLLNDFSVATAVHGGQVRIRELFTRVACHYDVTLLSLTSDLSYSEVRIAEGFKEVRVPKTTVHRAAEAEWNSRSPVSVSDILSSALCKDNHELVAHYRRHLRDSDLVILLHPYLAPLLDVVRPRVPVIYEALNVERVLKARTLRYHPNRRHLLRRVEQVETLACRVANGVVCVSDEDRQEFAKEVDPRMLEVVLNGVDTGQYRVDCELDNLRRLFGTRAVATFIGSAHPPNVEAVEFIVEHLASSHGDVYFLILGSACHHFRHRPLPPNVLLCGVVDAEEKEILLQLADVALNPMQSGGGSSLKVADYLAAGLPLLSTPIGTRGFDLIPRVHAVVAEREAFSEQLATLLGDAALREQLSRNGREYARTQLSWDLLGEKYRAIIEELQSNRRIRLLVTTFRFTDPPLGGAETYLLELMKQLHALGRFSIDVATFDVRAITNRWHFSAHYEPGSNAKPYCANRVVGFAPDQLARRRTMEQCRQLFALWQDEDLAHARRFIERFDEVVLLGGWHPPEQRKGALRRWTGARAEIYCPADTQAINIGGFAAGKTRVRLAYEGRPLHEQTLRGAFSLSADLGSLPAGTLQICADAAYRSRHDPRNLGICVTSISQSDGKTASHVPLQNDFASYLCRTDPAAWIGSLIDLTRGRSGDDDELFFNVRGPHSRAFEQWLETNISGYDVVLAHGTPFSHVAVTARKARDAGVPYVVLPHYHAEDKYYHWRHYYEAFAGADLVLVSPDQAKSHCFDKLGAHSLCVPGGGVNPKEFEDLASHAQAFRALHNSPRPFALVLGRKAGSKHYQRIIAAAEQLNEKQCHPCDVVMIGPDDDAIPINGPCVFYYGNQPRVVVLGALASCCCLVTMSDSESFGIVVVEAWMCEKPVVANRDCPAFAALVTHAVDGLLCRTDSELVDAMELLLVNPDLAHQLGSTGKQKARQRFTWEHIGYAVGTALSRIAMAPR